MKELVVISGKGGTGKTSVAASLASLAGRCVLVDCDVDAADLHLIFAPQVKRRGTFSGGWKASVDAERCIGCGQCLELCRFGAVAWNAADAQRKIKTCRIETLSCEGCGVCTDHCPTKAIALSPAVCGEWFASETRVGPMIHARLGVAAENSGKLVTLVRQAAVETAEHHGLDLILCDGSPGIGCPVIASLTGASLALFVIEPTVSGLHDFERVAKLALHLGVPGLLLVNKADINEQAAAEIETMAARHGIRPVGRIPYDAAVTRAQVAGQTIVEASNGPAAQAIRRAWQEIQNHFLLAATSSVNGLLTLR